MNTLGFDFRPWDVIVRKDDAAGPVYLAAFVSPVERARDEFAVEREELVLRLAWLRRPSPDAFSTECARLNALRGIRRDPAIPVFS